MATSTAAGLPELSKLFLLPVLAMSFSAVLYTLADPFIDKRLPTTANEPDLWHALVPILSKVVVLWLSWWGQLDAMNTFSVTTLIRAPFYFLLYLFYDISLSTVTICWLIDASSISLAFSLLGRGRRGDYITTHASRSIQNHALYDLNNVLLVILLATAVWALALFTLCVGFLPGWVVTNFYPVPSVTRPHEANHLSMVILCLPLGWALREFLFTPSTKVDRLSELPVFAPWIKSPRTIALFRRCYLLCVLVFGETFIRTFIAVGGSSVEGALIWASAWASMTYIVSSVLAWVEHAVDTSNAVQDDVK